MATDSNKRYVLKQRETVLEYLKNNLKPNGQPNIRGTARHFGMNRWLIYDWKKSILINLNRIFDRHSF